VNADFHFGLLPASASGTTGPTGPSGTTGPTAPVTDLQDYAKVKVNTPLPDATDTILSVVGVTSSGALRFAVKQELFINGPGTCVPSPTNCQALDLQPGDIETFQYDSPTLGLVTYELAITSVNGKTAASTASLHHGPLRLRPATVNAGPIHGQPVPVPLSSAQVSEVFTRGVLGPAPQLVG
jgi:hypothetical protein